VGDATQGRNIPTAVRALAGSGLDGQCVTTPDEAAIFPGS
jgi:hypothetical protein